MSENPIQIQRAVAEGIREGMDRAAESIARAVADAVRESMGSDQTQAQTESVEASRMREIRDVLDRFEILIEDLAANVQTITQNGGE